MLRPARTTTAIAFASATVALTVPSVAMGATTVGRTFSPTSSCGTTTKADGFNTGVATGNSFVVPSNGVLTSWSTTGPNTMKLKVYRSTETSNVYKVIGASTSQTTSSGTPSYPTRIPVQAGDIIGPGGATGSCAMTTGNSADAYEFRQPADAAVGDSNTYSPLTGFVFDVAAQLEPDVDGDGFGDETQDSCPTDPTTQGTCAADLSVTETADKTVASLGDTITYTLSVKNNSAFNAAHAVVVSDTVPANTTLVSASGAGVLCSSSNCTLGDLPKGASATVTVSVRATGEGTAFDGASVASSTPDPDSSNNAAAAATRVGAAEPIVLHPQTVKAKKGSIGVTVGCKGTAITRCVGTDTVRTSGKVLVSGHKRKLTLGSAQFAVVAGKATTVKVKLSKAARKLLSQKKKLSTTETAVGHDDRNITKTATAAIKIKA
jgi:uncharacterized repeat protein (TIGR01451 family)